MPRMVLFVDEYISPQELGGEEFSSEGAPMSTPRLDNNVLMIVFLDGKEVQDGRVDSFPSRPIGIMPKFAKAELQVSLFSRIPLDVSATQAPVASLAIPLMQLFSFGLPLYSSLWLGLDDGNLEASGDSITKALTRARDPSASKIRLTIFKPSNLVSLTTQGQGTQRAEIPLAQRSRESFRPDLSNFMSNADDDGLFCVDRPPIGPNAARAQVEGVLRCLEETNTTVRALQGSFASTVGGRGGAFFELSVANRKLQWEKQKLNQMYENAETKWVSERLGFTSAIERVRAQLDEERRTSSRTAMQPMQDSQEMDLEMIRAANDERLGALERSSALRERQLERELRELRDQCGVMVRQDEVQQRLASDRLLWKQELAEQLDAKDITWTTVLEHKLAAKDREIEMERLKVVEKEGQIAQLSPLVPETVQAKKRILDMQAANENEVRVLLNQKEKAELLWQKEKRDLAANYEARLRQEEQRIKASYTLRGEDVAGWAREIEEQTDAIRRDCENRLATLRDEYDSLQKDHALVIATYQRQAAKQVDETRRAVDAKESSLQMQLQDVVRQLEDEKRARGGQERILREMREQQFSQQEVAAGEQIATVRLEERTRAAGDLAHERRQWEANLADREAELMSLRQQVEMEVDRRVAQIKQQLEANVKLEEFQVRQASESSVEAAKENMRILETSLEDERATHQQDMKSMDETYQRLIADLKAKQKGSEDELVAEISRKIKEGDDRLRDANHELEKRVQQGTRKLRSELAAAEKTSRSYQRKYDELYRRFMDEGGLVKRGMGADDVKLDGMILQLFRSLVREKFPSFVIVGSHHDLARSVDPKKLLAELDTKGAGSIGQQEFHSRMKKLFGLDPDTAAHIFFLVESVDAQISTRGALCEEHFERLFVASPPVVQAEAEAPAEAVLKSEFPTPPKTSPAASSARPDWFGPKTATVGEKDLGSPKEKAPASGRSIPAASTSPEAEHPRPESPRAPKTTPAMTMSDRVSGVSAEAVTTPAKTSRPAWFSSSTTTETTTVTTSASVQESARESARDSALDSDAARPKVERPAWFTKGKPPSTSPQ